MADKPKPVPQKLGLVKKHEHKDTCKEGYHVYVVTSWQIGGGKEKAIAMRCQHCLMPLDLQEIESAEFRSDKGI